jgi:hypothetical protein
VLVIQDVDAALKELLVRNMPLDTSVIDVNFQMPNRDWAAKLSRLTLNLYLYDVRENVELSNGQQFLTRANDSPAVRRMPVRVDLTYLISAWATEIADEHQLLGSVLTTLLRFPLLPLDVLRGSLQDQPFPIQAWIGRPEHTKNPWDLWGNVDHRMKAALSYVVTAAFQPYPAERVQLVTQSVVNIAETGS